MVDGFVMDHFAGKVVEWERRTADVDGGFRVERFQGCEELLVLVDERFEQGFASQRTCVVALRSSPLSWS